MGGRGQSSTNQKSINLSNSGSGKLTTQVTSEQAFNNWQEKYCDKRDDGGYSFSNVPADKARELKDASLNSSTAFQLYLNDNNDYQKPKIITDKEFDAMAKSENLRIIYRGCNDTNKLSGREMHERFMNNDTYYTGNGVYGDGIYFGNKSTATYYAKEGGAYSGSKASTGSIIRAVLSKNAKVIDYEKATDLFNKNNPKSFYDDAKISAYTRSLGYDAISVKHPSGDTYINILNRGALIIASEIFDV